MEALNNDDISHKGKKKRNTALTLRNKLSHLRKYTEIDQLLVILKSTNGEYGNGDQKRAKSCNSLRRRKENKEAN